jgi:hypothetical protein
MDQGLSALSYNLILLFLALFLSRGGFVERLSQSKAAQQNVTKIITLIFINLVTSKAGAKRELLFNKPYSVLFCQKNNGFMILKQREEINKRTKRWTDFS